MCLLISSLLYCFAPIDLTTHLACVLYIVFCVGTILCCSKYKIFLKNNSGDSKILSLFAVHDPEMDRRGSGGARVNLSTPH